MAEVGVTEDFLHEVLGILRDTGSFDTTRDRRIPFNVVVLIQGKLRVNGNCGLRG